MAKVTREDRIRKVIALLNLADNNSSDQEKAKARIAAEAMMSKYSITENELKTTEFKVHVCELEVKSCPGWYKRIWYDVGTMLGCYVIYIKTPTGHNAQFHICGPEEEVIHLEYIARALHAQINQMAYQFFYDQPDMDRADRMPYRRGLAVRAIERLEELVDHVYETQSSGGFEDNLDDDGDDNPFAVVLVKDKMELAKQHYFEETGMTDDDVTTTRQRVPMPTGAYYQGYSDGDKLGLNKGVKSGGNENAKQMG